MRVFMTANASTAEEGSKVGEKNVEDRVRRRERQHGRLLSGTAMRAHTTYQSSSNSLHLIQPSK